MIIAERRIRLTSGCFELALTQRAEVSPVTFTQIRMREGLSKGKKVVGHAINENGGRVAIVLNEQGRRVVRWF